MKKSVFRRDQNRKQLLIDCNAYTEKEIEDFSRFYTSNYYEIHIIESKNIRLYTDNLQIDLSGTSILFLSPQNIRRWERENKEVKGNILLFEPDFISDFLKDSLFLYQLHIFHNNAIPYLTLNTGEYESYLSLFKEIEYEIHHFTPNSRDVINATLHYFLIRLNKQYSDFHSLSNDFLMPNLTCIKFLKLIDNQISNKRTVKEYARELNISNTQLNILLKKYLNTSASVLIKNRLAQEAKK
ncbi:MAG: hypothetical protein KAH64_01110, partial [Nitrosomonadaceae bacterium]|nr:hypothetical protein [Nitrosomonadaceae bacterium]